MNNLFNSLSQDLAPEGALQITDFGVRIISRTEAEIYYDIEGQATSSIVDINVEYEPAEAATYDCPAIPARAEIIDVFGLSVQERHAYDKFMADNDLEEELLYCIEGDKR